MLGQKVVVASTSDKVQMMEASSLLVVTGTMVQIGTEMERLSSGSLAPLYHKNAPGVGVAVHGGS